jgi:hypothetical protein
MSEATIEKGAEESPERPPIAKDPAPVSASASHITEAPAVAAPEAHARSEAVLSSRSGSASTPFFDPVVRDHQGGLKDEIATDESIDRRLAEIEMIGEETATGWVPQPQASLSPEVRFLHVSRTIHQLVTDRNRSVGIFLAVASILVAAATGLLNVKQEVSPIIPLNLIQYWCLPVTFATLAVLAIFISVLLIRARIGLIYEVTKMNTLLGLHSKRVERVNPLSIFYVMHLLVVVLGGASVGFFSAMIAYDWLDDGVLGVKVDPTSASVGVEALLSVGLVAALVFIILLQWLYYWTILRNTTDAKLDAAKS